MSTPPTTRPRRSKPTRPASRLPQPPREEPVTVGDLLKRLGNIPARRVLLHPTPGTATVADLIKILDGNERLCELVEGTLVEKPMGYEESEIAITISTEVNLFVRRRKLGVVTGEAGPFKLFGGLVRVPDVAFTSWDRFPGRKRPKAPVPDLAPDLAIEILSKSNTPAEMRRKLGEYFAAGVRLVWIVDPRKKTVRVHTSADRSILLEEGQSLDGGDVLPAFTLSLQKLFAKDEP